MTVTDPFAFSFADFKRQSRREVHATFAVAALYSDTVVTGVGVTVRYHNKILRTGNLQNSGYADIVEGIDRLIFDDAEMASKVLTLRRDGIVTIPEYGGAAFILDTRDVQDGPVEVAWNVVKVDT